MFNKKDITCWQGETVSLKATAPDATYQTATLLVGTPGQAAVFAHNATFVSNNVDLTIADNANTIPVGTYKYMVKIDFTDGATKYFPDPETCSTEDLPDFVVKARIGGSA